MRRLSSEIWPPTSLSMIPGGRLDLVKFLAVIRSERGLQPELRCSYFPDGDPA